LKPTPSAGAQRLEHIDALRGFALLGVCLSNLRDLSLYSFLPSQGQSALHTASADRICAFLFSTFVEMKALTVLTLVFGIGFAIQTRRIPMTFYARRLLGLFLIGLAHGVFWFNDILRLYALAGLGLIFTRRAPPVLLAVIGFAIAVLPWDLFASVPSDAGAMISSTYAAFSGHSFSGMIRANIQYDFWLRTAEWGFPIALFGRLIVGAAIGRSNVIIEPSKHLRFWRNTFRITLLTGGALIAFRLTGGEENFGEFTGNTAHSASSITLGLCYLAGFVLLFERSAWRARLRVFVPIGRMALTSYLLQTAIGIALFYGIGLGLGPRFGLIGLLPFCGVIFVAQLLFSKWWLERFTFGPIEWIWRCFSYGSVIPIRVSSSKR
jgi:uncharacterized protein